jgi:hypothetical protein
VLALILIFNSAESTSKPAKAISLCKECNQGGHKCETKAQFKTKFVPIPEGLEVTAELFDGPFNLKRLPLEFLDH